jgi:hypothetical protein
LKISDVKQSEIFSIRAYLITCGCAYDDEMVQSVLDRAESVGQSLQMAMRYIAMLKTECAGVKCSYCGSMYEPGKYECGRCGAPRK